MEGVAMDVVDAIEQRRAYRAIAPIEVQHNLIEDLARCAGLAPSCFNKQPWRFVIIYEDETLKAIYSALSSGNEWAKTSNLIVAVISNRSLDCIIGDREYFLFDVGLATAFMLLRATELGLVAHPIAGFDPAAVKTILKIPPDYQVVTLVVIGKKATAPSAFLSERQLAAEKERPPRQSLAKFVFHNHFQS